MKWINILEESCEIEFVENYVTTTQFIYDENSDIVKNGHKSDYTTVKSTTSKRRIPVDESFMKILKKHRYLQQQFAERKGVEFKETDPVFTGRWYRQMGKNTTNGRIQRAAEVLKIQDWDEITSHCIRKSFCCAGILNDVPIEYMSYLMGHNSIKVTQDFYLELNKGKINQYAQKANTNRVRALEKINQIYAQKQVS